MRLKSDKMRLATAAAAEAIHAHELTAPEFMDQARRPNVVGLGVGVKWKDRQPTGEPALIVLVTHKPDKTLLRRRDLIPGKLHGMQTDVFAVGQVTIWPEGPREVQASARKRWRPARGGASIGHHRITAGTIGAPVYDILKPEGSVSPPRHGLGIPERYYLLSNNHVLANSNDAQPGDAILQPGPYDGGKDPDDRIAVLDRFIRIQLTPEVQLKTQHNLVDAALARGEFEDFDRASLWTGALRGWRRKADVAVGLDIKKPGRTTSLSFGRNVAINALIDVGYGQGRTGRFQDQIVTTPMSAGGDSGSIVMTLDNVAVGLLFAGSDRATICNQIEHVRALLGVEVADAIL